MHTQSQKQKVKASCGHIKNKRSDSHARSFLQRDD